MIGLDTNVLVRYLAQDDAVQAARATELIESLDETEPGFVSIVVLVELHWVLRQAYGVSATDAAVITERLLRARELVVQDADVMRRALRHASSGVEFPDAVIGELGAAAGCTATVSFDRRAARHPGMTLL